MRAAIERPSVGAPRSTRRDDRASRGGTRRRRQAGSPRRGPRGGRDGGHGDPPPRPCPRASARPDRVEIGLPGRAQHDPRCASSRSLRRARRRPSTSAIHGDAREGQHAAGRCPSATPCATPAAPRGDARVPAPESGGRTLSGPGTSRTAGRPEPSSPRAKLRGPHLRHRSGEATVDRCPRVRAITTRRPAARRFPPGRPAPAAASLPKVEMAHQRRRELSSFARPERVREAARPRRPGGSAEAPGAGSANPAGHIASSRPPVARTMDERPGGARRSSPRLVWPARGGRARAQAATPGAASARSTASGTATRDREAAPGDQQVEVLHRPQRRAARAARPRVVSARLDATNGSWPSACAATWRPSGKNLSRGGRPAARGRTLALRGRRWAAKSGTGVSDNGGSRPLRTGLGQRRRSASASVAGGCGVRQRPAHAAAEGPRHAAGESRGPRIRAGVCGISVVLIPRAGRSRGGPAPPARHPSPRA